MSRFVIVRWHASPLNVARVPPYQQAAEQSRRDASSDGSLGGNERLEASSSLLQQGALHEDSQAIATETCLTT